MSDPTLDAQAQFAFDKTRQLAQAAGQTTRKDGQLDMVKARETARKFETFFLSQALQPMFEGTEVEEPFGGGHAEAMWKSMQVDEYAKALSKRGGIGIADKVLEQLVRMQENGHGR
jgi:Rod binding domain-containing protein